MEKWARTNLWERDFEVYLPTYNKQRRHARKVDWVSKPLFPRYLFVSADLQAGERRHIITAPGVNQLVAFSNRPAPIGDDVIEEIRAREDESGHINLVDPNALKPGDKVQLHAGALCDSVGLFQEMADKDRVVILLSLMGRAVKVKAPINSVQRVA
jgi:transcriptional antiterminator RfaH